MVLKLFMLYFCYTVQDDCISKIIIPFYISASQVLSSAVLALYFILQKTTLRCPLMPLWHRAVQYLFYSSQFLSRLWGGDECVKVKHNIFTSCTLK